MIMGWSAENGVLQVLEQRVDDSVEFLESLMIIFFQSYVDCFEELERIVQDLIVTILKILSANTKNTKNKLFEVDSGDLYHVSPKSCVGFSFKELSHHFLCHRFDIS